VAQTNYNSATGQSDFAFEATAQANAASGHAGANNYVAFFQPRLQAIGTAPQSAQVNAIPGQPAGNSAQLPLQASGAIFTTDFDRGGQAGNSCNAYGSVNLRCQLSAGIHAGALFISWSFERGASFFAMGRSHKQC
jgi:hypothetical protein